MYNTHRLMLALVTVTCMSFFAQAQDITQSPGSEKGGSAPDQVPETLQAVLTSVDIVAAPNTDQGTTYNSAPEIVGTEYLDEDIMTTPGEDRGASGNTPPVQGITVLPTA